MLLLIFFFFFFLLIVLSATIKEGGSHRDNCRCVCLSSQLSASCVLKLSSQVCIPLGLSGPFAELTTLSLCNVLLISDNILFLKSTLTEFNIVQSCFGFFMEESGHSNWYRYLLLYTLPFSERPLLIPVLAKQKKFEEGFCSYKNRQKSKWKRKEMRGKMGQQTVCVLSHSVMSDSLGPHGLQPTGSSIHGDSSGKTTGIGCHALFQGIFPTQEQNPGLLHCKWILYCLNHQGSP